jgi:hypothetical protein
VEVKKEFGRVVAKFVSSGDARGDGKKNPMVSNEKQIFLAPT